MVEDTKKDALLKMLHLEKPDVTDDARNAFENFMRADNFIEILEDYQKELRERMFEIAEREGLEDDKGSFTVEFPDGTGFKKEARHYVSINEDKAKELAEEKGIPLVRTKKKLTDKSEELVESGLNFLEQNLPDAIDYEDEVDEDYIEQAYLNGEITEEELKMLVNRDIRYALRKFTG